MRKSDDRKQFQIEHEFACNNTQSTTELLLLSAVNCMIEHVIDLEKRGASLYHSRSVIKQVCAHFHIHNPLANNPPGKLK